MNLNGGLIPPPITKDGGSNDSGIGSTEGTCHDYLAKERKKNFIALLSNHSTILWAYFKVSCGPETTSRSFELNSIWTLSFPFYDDFHSVLVCEQP